MKHFFITCYAIAIKSGCNAISQLTWRDNAYLLIDWFINNLTHRHPWRCVSICLMLSIYCSLHVIRFLLLHIVHFQLISCFFLLSVTRECAVLFVNCDYLHMSLLCHMYLNLHQIQMGENENGISGTNLKLFIYR